MEKDPDDRLIAPWSRSSRTSARVIAWPIRSFMRWQAAGGVALLVATVVALIWANTAGDSYTSFWSTSFTLGLGDHVLTTNLLAVVNDALMFLFFLLIGLEIKRELAIGELADRRAAALPLAAALGGMILPAGIYLAINAGTPVGSGWGIPMATDVAFALAVLSVLRSRVPQAIWAFLLGVAVIDDIGAIIVIAIAYSSGISLAWLAAAAGALVMMRVLISAHVRALPPYLILALLAWAFTAASGVHATIAGVAIGLLMPARAMQRPAAVSRAAREVADQTSDDPSPPDADDKAWTELAHLSRGAVSPASRLIHALQPWSSFVVLPLFALANAGIVLSASTFEAPFSVRAAVGVGLALVVGKAIGIPLGAFIALRTGLGRMPEGARWSQMMGVGLLGGIGFTVSMFVTDLAFTDPSMSEAVKAGVLGASVVAALLGAFVLARAGRTSGKAH
ncbi:MAG: Na+/H+ antiporter NhaA [Thermoleophilia bacterium]